MRIHIYVSTPDALEHGLCEGEFDCFFEPSTLCLGSRKTLLDAIKLDILIGIDDDDKGHCYAFPDFNFSRWCALGGKEPDATIMLTYVSRQVKDMELRLMRTLCTQQAKGVL